MSSALYALNGQGQLVHIQEQDVPAEDGVTARCKSPADAADPSFVLYEVTLAPHRRFSLTRLCDPQTATIYIIAGTLAVRLGEQAFTVNDGNVVQVGPGTTCVTWNPTSASVRCLVMVRSAPA